MRAEGDNGASETDCDDPAIALACSLESDACPAECKEGAKDEEKEDTVVKSGDLEVTAKAAANTKVLATWTADLDTLTFKTSEEVEISKITLERYGYSKEGQIAGVRLEDQDGNIIAESKTLTKDKVTLNIKKNYRNVDGKFEATVVVKTDGASGTIGFKVTDVESTAKNLNLDDYSPYTYDVTDYNGSIVTVELKGSDKTYNYEEWESYEIGRVRVAASDSSIIVKGFTLTNGGRVDMKESLDKLTIKADSKEVDAKYSVNKDDELVVSFSDEVEVQMNKKVTFILYATFKDFDDYGETIEYYISEDSNFNAVESKNGTRVNLNINAAKTRADATVYTFNGGKIKLANKKLGNVDAAQASEGVVVAEGDVTVTEPISKVQFTIKAKKDGAKYIKNLYFVVDGDEYEAKGPALDANGLNTVDANGDYVFTFKDISIEKSGKIQFKVDIMDPTNGIQNSPEIDFTTPFNWELITAAGTAKYDNVSKQYVQPGDVAGSISFSKVTIQAAKAALENTLTKNVEFLLNETSRKVVFDGTYTAKKGGDIDLNKFFIYADGGYDPTDNANANQYKNKITFYLFVDGEEVADTNIVNSIYDLTSPNLNTETFSDVRVKAGEKVKVKVEAEVEAYGTTAGKLPATNKNFRLFLLGTDMSGNEDTGKGEEDLISMETKAKGSVTVPSTTEAKTALLRAQNTTIAKFTVKPSNGNEGITLEELVLSGTVDNGQINRSKLRVKVGWIELDDPAIATNTDADATANIEVGDFIFSANEEIPSEGLVVEVIYKDELSGEFEIDLKSVNKKKFTNTYSKYLVDSLVTFTKQDEGTTSTEYTVKVEYADDSYSVTDFVMYSGCTNWIPDWTKTDGDTVAKYLASLSDEETFTIMRGDKAVEICAIQYTTNGDQVQITKKDYKDYFKVNGKELAIPKA